MRLRSAALIACTLLSTAAFAQDLTAARQLLKDAEERAESIQNKDNHGYWLAEIAEAWQPIDKNAALGCLERAADAIPLSSWAWGNVLRVWANQNSETAFHRAIALKSTSDGPARIGEVVALIAARDVDKASSDMVEVPASIRQEVAQTAVTELAFSNQDLCETFIQGLSGVNRDMLYQIVAADASDPQISLKAARKAGKASSSALVAAIAKTAQNDPALAFGLVSEVNDADQRAIALAYCANAFSRGDIERAKQAAAQAIVLFEQSPPEWPIRSKQFVQIEPLISDIDSPDVRGFLQRFTDQQTTHFSNASDDEIVNQPTWLIVCATAWSRLDFEKAHAFAAQALQSDPDAGIKNAMIGGISIPSIYERYLVELAKSYSDETATLLASIKSTSKPMFDSTTSSVLAGVQRDFLSQARLIAKQLGGGWPNIVEVQKDLNEMTPDSSSDGLLRVESDGFSGNELWDNAERFTDALIQVDPYKAVRSINFMESRSHRIPLLSRVIVAIAKTNPGLAESLFEGAVRDINLNMPPDDKVRCQIAMARAAIALNK